LICRFWIPIPHHGLKQVVVLAEGRFWAGVEPEMLTIGKPLSILVPLSISNLSTAALIPVLRSEDYFDAQTRNRGGGVLAQDIDRPHLMSINSDRIRQHSKPQMATMPRCNLFERRKVLLLQNINAGRNMSDSGYGKQQEKQANRAQVN
jgi:hypothetical protein